MPLAAARTRRRLGWTELLLAALLVWAIALRFVYADKDLHTNRFWDENWSEPNVHAALEEGRFLPVRYIYFRLTYLPQIAVLGTAQWVARRFDPEFSWFVGEHLKPAAMLTCRGVQTLWGGLSILLTFLLGRRLFSREVGLAGAFLVAVAPFHFMLSATFKPDILLLAMTLLAFWWSLDALDRATLGRYVLAGCGIGLAVSSKATGGAAAIPLTVGAILLGWKHRRHWLGLVAAGATASAVFLLLTPNLPAYVNALKFMHRGYQARAPLHGGYPGPLGMAWRMLVSSFEGYHGRWVGLAAAAGMVVIVFGIWKNREAGRLPLQRALLLVFFAGYSVLYAAATKHLMGQNLLPLLPVTALAAAVALVAVWRWVAARLPARARPAIAVVVIGALALAAADRVHRLTYRTRVPSTRQQAVAALVEVAGGQPLWVRWRPAGSEQASRMDMSHPPGVPQNLLFFDEPGVAAPPGGDRLMDAEVFLAAAERRERLGAAGTRLFPSAPFRAWGPDRAAILHPWRRVASQALDLRRRPGYRWLEADDWMPMRIDRQDMRILADNNLCRRLPLPAGARIRLGYGLNRGYLSRQRARRFAAEFKLQLAFSEDAEPEVLFADTLRLADPDVMSRPQRTETVDLGRFSGQRVNLCVRTRSLARGDREELLGVAFWNRLEVVDGEGRRHRDTFRHRLAERGAEAVALVIRQPGETGEAPEVRARGASLGLLATPSGGRAGWTTERFVFEAADPVFEIRLPETVEARRLAVEVLFFERGGDGGSG